MHIDDHQFSPREKEVLELLLQGKSNKEIALALGVSVSTVEFHLKNVYSKLKVKSRTEAVLQLRESTGSDKTNKMGESIGKAADKQRESIVDGKGVKVENDGNTFPKRRILMSKWFYVIGGLLLAIGLSTVIVFARFTTNNARISPTNTFVASGTAIPEIFYMGTSFTFPPGLGDGTQNEIVPETTEFMIWPKHIKLTVVDYPLSGTTSEPRILVFPAKELAQMHSCYEATIRELKNMLATQSVSGDDLPCDKVDTLPFLPDPHAGQYFHTQEKILSFQTGTGIRYITQYGQAAFPAINNMDLFYTFQGLTSDGKYYVSVILPISLPDLPAADDPLAFQHPAEWQNPEKYPDYLKTTVEKLSQADNPFNPSLDSLDALVRSLRIVGQE